ncbi:DNA-3-methyladenine glycosylase I [Corynebacterium imitans]|uniref:DNA-3-methyladenine glycosylase I n=1 Tax=Corynebacterium imitans TaxID=156978 RepID=UPI00254C6DB0|nr:DNA-3-methyladenine glycosylase I [Corynebacterium imitans]MDK8306474.1 DNA-3-methyladenine glycosylase I [Corynebacterium imitans]MDK8637443.1 DNA-3-methyladenine glycosylase I [Corynebacterium imitans]MDK8772658.1 DNA-3-methyladenine glycosylase I [Corynebacterium imitans]
MNNFYEEPKSLPITCDDGLVRPPWAATDPLLRTYYDTEWGMPLFDEASLYERLCLEGFQVGLSWRLILSKREAFREAFFGFDPDKVAAMESIDHLMDNASLIRNRQKLNAAITNAKATVALRDEGTHLGELIWSYKPEATPRPRTAEEVPTFSPESKALARDLKKRGFTFVGPVTMYALMESVGIVDTNLVGTWRRGASGVWGD